MYRRFHRKKNMNANTLKANKKIYHHNLEELLIEKLKKLKLSKAKVTIDGGYYTYSISINLPEEIKLNEKQRNSIKLFLKTWAGRAFRRFFNNQKITDCRIDVDIDLTNLTYKFLMKNVTKNSVMTFSSKVFSMRGKNNNYPFINFWHKILQETIKEL